MKRIILASIAMTLSLTAAANYECTVKGQGLQFSKKLKDADTTHFERHQYRKLGRHNFYSVEGNYSCTSENVCSFSGIIHSDNNYDAEDVQGWVGTGRSIEAINIVGESSQTFSKSGIPVTISCKYK